MDNEFEQELLIDEEEGADEDGQIDEYDLTSSPNDFNVMTINSYIEAGSIVIPGFQRNFVWDIKKASKLIESLILGLPVPQLFLYESARNKFLVIDGQQRMMSIFYFLKKRFPKKEKRAVIRKLFSDNDVLPEAVLENDEYFQPFKLQLSKSADMKKNKFHGLNYSTLGDYKSQLDLRPIRNIVVKQNSPKNDDSSIYEIFNRLNSGGVNLKPQEIRACLYHSDFYTMLSKLNYEPIWRKVLKMDNQDLHMKDIELLLRCFAMANEYTNYKPSLATFLNTFSKKAKEFDTQLNAYFYDLFLSFLNSIAHINPEKFVSEKSKRFNIFIFEALFSAMAHELIKNKQLINCKIDQKSFDNILHDPNFQTSSVGPTTNSSNVFQRFKTVEQHLKLNS